MRVLVTGVGGYLGWAIAQALHAQRFDVVGWAHVKPATTLPFEVHHGDLHDPDTVKAWEASLSPCEAIVHAAASLDMRPDQVCVTQSNALATHRLLVLARTWSCSRFVLLSSASLIGPPRDVPATETHPVNPPTVYHASKFYCEELVRHCCHDGMVGTCLRITAPIGSHMPRNRMVRMFVERAMRNEDISLYGQGTRRQDYVDERDVSSAVLCALHHGGPGVFNIGSGQSHANAEVAKRCIEVLRSASTVTFAENLDPEEGVRWEFSIAKAERELGYRPAHTLQDSIQAIAGHIAEQN